MCKCNWRGETGKAESQGGHVRLVGWGGTMPLKRRQGGMGLDTRAGGSWLTQKGRWLETERAFANPLRVHEDSKALGTLLWLIFLTAESCFVRKVGSPANPEFGRGPAAPVSCFWSPSAAWLRETPVSQCSLGSLVEGTVLVSYGWTCRPCPCLYVKKW